MMRVWAYCAASFAPAAKQAAGIAPLTCPPLDDTSIAKWFNRIGYDFVYLDLHGQPGAAHWFGDDGKIAMRAETVRGLALDGAVVFATNCYLGDMGSPMLDALLDAGARLVVAGEGVNYGSTLSARKGATQLGLWTRRLMQLGMQPEKAVAMAKRTLGRGKAAADTQAFRVFGRRGGSNETD